MLKLTGTVAVYIKSESADSSLYCFEDKTVDEIANVLRQDMDMFCPISEWLTNGEDEAFLDVVDNLMHIIYNESWEVRNE